MKYLLLLAMPVFLSCNEVRHRTQQTPTKSDIQTSMSYTGLKSQIAKDRQAFKKKYKSPVNEVPAITNYWVDNVSDELFRQWEGTPWDFNGTTVRPKEGAIACGYFVNSILQDMDLKINRRKLSVCTSSDMMRQLCPSQKIQNLSALNYTDFNRALLRSGKGVYIIGLDFHTGLVVNDGSENYFIHSYYVDRIGVIKEPVLSSPALKSSKTRWLVCLTRDKDFIGKWLNG